MVNSPEEQIVWERGEEACASRLEWVENGFRCVIENEKKDRGESGHAQVLFWSNKDEKKQ